MNIEVLTLSTLNLLVIFILISLSLLGRRKEKAKLKIEKLKASEKDEDTTSLQVREIVTDRDTKEANFEGGDSESEVVEVDTSIRFSKDEIKILQYLLDKNGEAYQVELYKNLNIPKSTVTRILRKLVDRGLIVIERRGKYNYVKLTDRSYVKNLLNSTG